MYDLHQVAAHMSHNTYWQTLLQLLASLNFHFGLAYLRSYCNLISGSIIWYLIWLACHIVFVLYLYAKTAGHFLHSFPSLGYASCPTYFDICMLSYVSHSRLKDNTISSFTFLWVAQSIVIWFKYDFCDIISLQNWPVDETFFFIKKIQATFRSCYCSLWNGILMAKK